MENVQMDDNLLDELKKEIQAEDPNFNPDEPSNVVSVRFRDISKDKEITVLDFNDIKDSDCPPIEYVIEPCLPTQGIGFIYAAAGVGKTLFTLNLAYAIASGGDFLKYSCPAPRKVLYVDGEMPFNELKSRVMLIAKQQGDLDTPSNFKVITPDKNLGLIIPPIDTEEGQQRYIDLVVRLDIDVVIFDNLSMLTSIDENKSSEWKIVQDFLLHLRSIGKTVIIIHHASKDKRGYRGTSRMLDCAHFAISLQATDDDLPDDEMVKIKKFKVEYQKSRGFGGKDAMSFEIILQENKWSYRSIELTRIEQIKSCIAANMTQREIGIELGISQSTAGRLIRKSGLASLVRSP